MFKKFQIIFLTVFPAVSIFLAFQEAQAQNACEDVPPGGHYTVTNSCYFEGSVNGVDEGNLTIRTGSTLTIQAGQSIVWNQDFSIIIEEGASIAINKSGGQLVKSNLWMLDRDNNGYPGDLDQRDGREQPTAEHRRRNEMTTIIELDCNDDRQEFAPYRMPLIDGDGDKYHVIEASEPFCTTIQTYEDDECINPAAKGFYAIEDPGESCVMIDSYGTDCDDRNSDLAPYRSKYEDNDNDNYTVGIASVCATIEIWGTGCGLEGTTHAKDSDGTCFLISPLLGTDCYDYNADARPGQTSFFTVHRGDESFDYNCDDVEELEDAVVADCPKELEVCENGAGWNPFGSTPDICGGSGDWLTCQHNPFTGECYTSPVTSFRACR